VKKIILIISFVPLLLSTIVKADDITRSFASCSMEAAKIYPRGAAIVGVNSTHNYSHDEELELTGQMTFMYNCMIKDGYLISLESNQCQANFSGFQNQKACWVKNKN
jgi:hypothetical protein